MIVTEQVGNLYHTYSNAGFMVHGGEPEADYSEAWDPIERTYTETDIPAETPSVEDKAAAYDIITGGAE